MHSLLLVTAVALGLFGATKPNDATLGQKPPADAIVLFNGKDLEGWVKRDGKAPAAWPVEDGIFTVGQGNIMTAKPFGDFQLHLEFNVPYMPKAKGQARGNSGVYLDGIYELQVLDSYGLADLTMRRLAAELGGQHRVLHRHAAGGVGQQRVALVEQIDQAFGIGFEADAADGDGDQRRLRRRERVEQHLLVGIAARAHQQARGEALAGNRQQVGGFVRGRRIHVNRHRRV